MQIVGVLFIITTTLILFYKRERNTQNSSKSVEDDLSLKETYKTVWKITQLPAARKLIFILFTFRIAFSLNSVVILKLIDKGVTREMIGVLAGLATPFDIMLPVLISKWTNGPNPLHFFIRAYPYR
jgi:PAT family acetyl-CoA transporter-like MFS transporter 1